MQIIGSFLFLANIVSTAQTATWPWDTTTPAPSAVSAFETGVVNALGFQNISSCYQDPKTGIDDLWEAAADYHRGGIVSKAEALVKFGGGIGEIVLALEQCVDSATDSSKFQQLFVYLRDPRYYTVHNALTLALNLAEDRHKLEVFRESWGKGVYWVAGFEMISAAFDVLLNPGIPMTNGTEASRIAQGMAQGYGIDLDCFTDLSVQIPMLIGGVLDLAAGVKILEGLESLFHGLEGLVPTFKECAADSEQIMKLLHDFEDFAHPVELAKRFLQRIQGNKIDMALEVASAVLAYKGQEWRRFGQALGDILGKLIKQAPPTIVV